MNVIQWPYQNTINIHDQVNPVNNYMWMVVQPTPAYASQVGYYMQFRITINGTSHFTNNIYCYSGINGGNAVMDVHKVLQNFVSFDTTAFMTANCNTYVTNNTLGYYSIGCYEYVGSVLQSGFIPYAAGGQFINAAADRNQVWNMQQYIFDTGNGKFLTDWQGDHYVRMSDRCNLQYYYDNDSTVSSQSVQEVYIHLYDANNNQLMKGYCHNAQMNGGGVLAFGCGPVEVNLQTWYQSPNSGGTAYYNILTNYPKTAYYTISLLLNPSNTSQGLTKFWIDRTDTLIDNAEIFWLNKLGSWSNYTFYKEIHQLKEVVRTAYTKNDFYWNGSSMGTVPWTRGETVLTVDEDEKWSFKSRVLSDQMSMNLIGIETSPEVYMLIDGYIYPMIVDDSEMEVLKARNTLTNPQGRNIYTITMHKANKEITIHN